MDRIRAILAGLSTKEILAFVIALLIGLAAFSYAGHRLGAWNEQRKFEKAQKEKTKQIQAALAAAEKFNESAKAKEATAAEMERVNGQKAAVAKEKTAEIAQQDKAKQDEIEQNYKDAQARINSDMSDCDRIRESCATAAKLQLQLDICSSPCQ
jgi:biopolymer transport protein ExbB/TolQ